MDPQQPKQEQETKDRGQDNILKPSVVPTAPAPVLNIPSTKQVSQRVRVNNEDEPVTYLCGDCGEENTLKPGQVIQCQECGYRVLYKKRTRRIIEYQAR